MKFSMTALLISGAALLAGHARAADSPAMKTYLHMKQDSDIYLGEGLAEAKEFDGDTAKALEASHTRAKGALAEAIHVRVSSQVSESLQSKDGQANEEMKSSTRSQAEVDIDNIKFMEFADFPDKGQMTVLALVGKEDYRRQLAGKGVKVFEPEYGFRIGGVVSLPDEADLHLDTPHHPGGDPAGLKLDFIWRGFYLGYQIQFDVSGTSDQIPKSFNINALNLGYDWSPWAWRVQPILPVQVRYSYWDMDPSFAQTFSASAGLGVRYWANDTVAFQIQGTWNQGLWGGAIYQSGGNFVAVNGHDAHVSMTGPELGAGITWSGF
jgi:hypothetical protein